MIRSRIAPTPSGYLHIGNALNFVLIWLWVRRVGGTLRLRIDDRDTPRSRPEHIDDIFRSLEWMGIDWDEGPQTPDEEEHIYSQALRTERYDDLLMRLIATGQVFPCECSRKDMHTRACHCRERSLAIDHPDTALRIATPAVSIHLHDVRGDRQVPLDREMKDFIIRRRDGIPAYQLVSLADDIDHHINLIIRGDDLLGSSAAQLYLASLIGESGFQAAAFYHHPLLYDEKGSKLSKSSGSPSLRAMREGGMTREAFYIRMSCLLGLPDPCTSIQQLLKREIPLIDFKH
jgi:glutamyl-tRNA synthetase